MPDIARDEAFALLKEYNSNPGLINHALAVEGVMRHFAGLYDADPGTWGITGLLHDLDYEKYPDEHCKKTEEILEEKGYPAEIIRAAVSHGYGICTNIKPETDMEKVLYAIDELTGLITATVYVRPSRSVLDLSVKSVRKKWKQKGFSAGVNRELIEKGAGDLGMELDDLIRETIEGMKTVASEIGLEGSE